MLEYRYRGRRGRRLRLAADDELIVVRGRAGRMPRECGSGRSRELLRALETVVEFRHAGVAVLRANPARRELDCETALRRLRADRGFRFAGRGLVDPRSRRPVVYTENLFVAFADDASRAAVSRILRRHRLRRDRPLACDRNAIFVKAPSGTGREVFRIAARLLDEHAEVLLCHPELVRERARKAAFPQQWHLRATTIDDRRIEAHAHVESAWALARGAGATIAVIDDGVDPDHVELARVVEPRDVTLDRAGARPRFAGDNHGTACAGVACAAGVDGASGVAPDASLMPLRLASGLGSHDEAEAFVLAADRGADAISVSWGPRDGRWWDPLDPAHRQIVPLPDHTRLALEHAATRGREGRGCVVAWAAGNGNEPLSGDGYASAPQVIAVGACNDRGRRSVYSDHGSALWCCFPSNDFDDPLTPGIWTTDRSGASGYDRGDYANDFGGTSAAAPGVAGLAALVLSMRPSLTAAEVRALIAATCDRIDVRHGEYDGTGHSVLYGYGRVNALRALEALRDA